METRFLNIDMRMKRRVNVLTTFVVVTTARIADMATTFYFSPNLKYESNPLANNTGMEFSTLLLSNIVLVFIFIYFPLSLYWLKAAKKTDVHISSAWEYASLSLYGCVIKKVKLIRAVILGWPLPKDWLQVVRCMGIVLSWGVAVASWMAVLAWWASFSWSWTSYMKFRAAIVIGNVPLLEILAGYLTCIIVTPIYFKLEYKYAKEQLKSVPLNMDDETPDAR